MSNTSKYRDLGLLTGALACGMGALASPAAAGGFAVREQSTTYLGSAFAGSAAGGDISSIFWNSAATAVTPGCMNFSSSYTAVLGSSDESARPGPAFVAAGLSPGETNVGSDAVVPASYLTCQISEKLFVGVGMNSQFGFLTKPDDQTWVGSPIAITSRVFSINLNPTVAYKVTPSLTVGIGLQIEYFWLRLTHGALTAPVVGTISGARRYQAEDWGVGATAGVLWQPLPGTSVGVGYRSAVGIDPNGIYRREAGGASRPAVVGDATAGITLPDQVTFSVRQAIAPRWTALGTVEWTNWSRVGDVAATGQGCGPANTCEVLNLNYRDSWFFALGAEFDYSPGLTLRGGVAYEISPIDDHVRDILLPDSNRVFLSFGASYRYSESITVDLAYSHIFFEDAPFCIASQALNGGSTHCRGTTPAAAVLLRGESDNAVDLISVGLRYKY